MYDIALSKEIRKKKIIDFAIEQFIRWKIPSPSYKTLQTLLAHTWDWINIHSRYLYDLLGIDILDLTNEIINIKEGFHFLGFPCYGNSVSDVNGKGFYIFERFESFNYLKILNDGPFLPDAIKRSLTDWNSYHPISFDDSEFLIANKYKDSQIILATWSLLVWLVSPEGIHDLEMISPWIGEILDTMNKYKKRDLKYVHSNFPNQINGGALLVDYYTLDFYDLDYFIDENCYEFDELQARTKLIKKTGQEVFDPDLITLTGRNIEQCKNCGLQLGCVDEYSFENTRTGEEEQYYLCRACAQLDIYDDLVFLGGTSLKSPRYGCLGIMIKWILDHGLDKKSCLVIMKASIDTYDLQSFLGTDMSHRDLEKFFDERGITESEMKRIVGFLLSRNACYTNNYGRNCPLIEFSKVIQWFITLNTDSLIEKMKLGVYKPHALLE